jgi:hypothetical protein
MHGTKIVSPKSPLLVTYCYTKNKGFACQGVIITPASNHLKGCHAGLDPASSLFIWIPAFAGMTEI